MPRQNRLQVTPPPARAASVVVGGCGRGSNKGVRVRTGGVTQHGCACASAACPGMSGSLPGLSTSTLVSVKGSGEERTR